jgi:hypothetical protein
MKVVRLMALGTLVLSLGAMLDCMYSKRCRKHTENHLDDALDGTFPASDPTATQDFAIPVNRL